mmetsp:Transcript_35464/g.80488  ORF Transcript_35464/g.80488 Transcript_35464/m.80488 type:complete len:206 (+) Transcript_35464:977-1594(+)
MRRIVTLDASILLSAAHFAPSHSRPSSPPRQRTTTPPAKPPHRPRAAPRLSATSLPRERGPTDVHRPPRARPPVLAMTRATATTYFHVPSEATSHCEHRSVLPARSPTWSIRLPVPTQICDAKSQADGLGCRLRPTPTEAALATGRPQRAALIGLCGTAREPPRLPQGAPRWSSLPPATSQAELLCSRQTRQAEHSLAVPLQADL